MVWSASGCLATGPSDVNPDNAKSKANEVGQFGAAREREFAAKYEDILAKEVGPDKKINATDPRTGKPANLSRDEWKKRQEDAEKNARIFDNFINTGNIKTADGSNLYVPQQYRQAYLNDVMPDGKVDRRLLEKTTLEVRSGSETSRLGYDSQLGRWTDPNYQVGRTDNQSNWASRQFVDLDGAGGTNGNFVLSKEVTGGGQTTGFYSESVANAAGLNQFQGKPFDVVKTPGGDTYQVVPRNEQLVSPQQLEQARNAVPAPPNTTIPTQTPERTATPPQVPETPPTRQATEPPPTRENLQTPVREQVTSPPRTTETASRSEPEKPPATAQNRTVTRPVSGPEKIFLENGERTKFVQIPLDPQKHAVIVMSEGDYNGTTKAVKELAQGLGVTTGEGKSLRDVNIFANQNPGKEIVIATHGNTNGFTVGGNLITASSDLTDFNGIRNSIRINACFTASCESSGGNHLLSKISNITGASVSANDGFNFGGYVKPGQQIVTVYPSRGMRLNLGVSYNQLSTPLPMRRQIATRW